MGRDWDAFQKHYQNRVQKVINRRLYERDMFSAEKKQSQARPTRQQQTYSKTHWVKESREATKFCFVILKAPFRGWPNFVLELGESILRSGLSHDGETFKNKKLVSSLIQHTMIFHACVNSASFSTNENKLHQKSTYAI